KYNFKTSHRFLLWKNTRPSTRWANGDNIAIYLAQHPNTGLFNLQGLYWGVDFQMAFKTSSAVGLWTIDGNWHNGDDDGYYFIENIGLDRNNTDINSAKYEYKKVKGSNLASLGPMILPKSTCEWLMLGMDLENIYKRSQLGLNSVQVYKNVNFDYTRWVPTIAYTDDFQSKQDAIEQFVIKGYASYAIFYISTAQNGAISLLNHKGPYTLHF
ncbi:TPA: hypothetical protein RTG57_001715, partial [Campylobacter jejuni]|nr:hypothetical protein [Campylobacter jejuni]